MPIPSASSSSPTRTSSTARTHRATGVALSARSAGARDATRDAAAAIQHHVAARFDELAAELDDAGQAAARDVDAALRALADAYRARTMVAGRVDALIATATGAARRGSSLAREWRSWPPWPKRCSTPG